MLWKTRLLGKNGHVKNVCSSFILRQLGFCENGYSCSILIVASIVVISCTSCLYVKDVIKGVSEVLGVNCGVY